MRFHRSVCQGSSHRLRIPEHILSCIRYGEDRKGIPIASAFHSRGSCPPSFFTPSLQTQYFSIVEGYEKKANKSYRRTGEGKMWRHRMLGAPDKVCRKWQDSRCTRRTCLQKADSIPSQDLLQLCNFLKALLRDLLQILLVLCRSLTCLDQDDYSIFFFPKAMLHGNKRKKTAFYNVDADPYVLLKY